ncbi:VIT and vWA domain-containing protein [Rhodoferax aquaticus]|uniref:VWA domain-containing protein n=1 Tax=Rhodoferax aquaticus TaxID=2527691 RepID=A0A515ERV2_9BURK|nr:VIT and VWA domain-containing protein [Rhodoferax aquaticus]QDL55343.1 VWA domain-containing protein [Rhodoferax aquaticus]
MAIAVLSEPAQPSRLSRWLWLATTSLSAVCFVALVSHPVHAQDTDNPRLKTESPYFLVKSDNPGVDQLPLKSTQVNVKVSGVIADVTVVQTYKNEGQRAIEAKYVFPGSTRAAVHGMNVRLADRLITAKIREKQQAKIEYDDAKAQGKTAALLEQHLPNVFQMNVANIMPGDDVKVELRYTELLVPTDGKYQFVFPTVVGPRYNSPQSGQANATWVAQPYLPQGQNTPTSKAAPAFDIHVSLNTPIGIKEVTSPSHTISSYSEQGGATVVGLNPTAEPTNNRDFILDYRLAGDKIESGLLLYKGATENFFLAMVEPPKAPPATAISPREYIFVVDISGSMHGFPLDTAKGVLRELIGGLRPSDTFNVLLFSGSNNFLSPKSVPATKANIEQAIRTIDQQGGGGSTELIPALKRVYAQAKTADVSRTVVVVTDGYVTVEREAFELVRNNLSSANVFSFGIGSSVNRHLMEGLARAGMGEPFIITKPEQAAEQAKRFRTMIESPVLTQVKARIEGLDVYDVEPRNLPDLLAQRPVIVYGKWRGEPKGKLIIEGQSASGPIQHTLPVAADTAKTTDTAALRHLWARNRIAALSDQEALEGGDTYAKAITDLGLQYSLLTQYTSFLAVDQVVRNKAPADSTGVNQPSPLPEGVENSSLGTEVPSTPEPATWGAIAMTISVLGMLAYRRRRALARAHHYTS